MKKTWSTLIKISVSPLRVPIIIMKIFISQIFACISTFTSRAQLLQGLVVFPNFYKAAIFVSLKFISYLLLFAYF